jgi:hypothetical protein
VPFCPDPRPPGTSPDLPRIPESRARVPIPSPLPESRCEWRCESRRRVPTRANSPGTPLARVPTWCPTRHPCSKSRDCQSASRSFRFLREFPKVYRTLDPTVVILSPDRATEMCDGGCSALAISGQGVTRPDTSRILAPVGLGQLTYTWRFMSFHML